MSEPTKKNFSSLAPSGAEKIDPEVSKFEKCYFLGFLKKGPQGPPKRSKINSNGIFGYWGPKWATKKFSAISGNGGAKIVYMLNEQCQSYLDRIILLEMGYKKISVAHLGPQYPKIMGSWGHFSKKKTFKQQFQSLILPDQFSRPPMELEA